VAYKIDCIHIFVVMCT